MNLLEQYKGRLRVAERVYAQQHSGERLSESKKLATAKLLENTSKFINEAFTSSVGTQAVSDLGLFKKFAMNLTNVVVPNLIANDIAIVYPMSSMSGYLNYIQYVTGNDKGEYQAGDLLMNPWQIGQVRNPSFTSNAVVETVASGENTLAWKPVYDVADLPAAFDAEGKLVPVNEQVAGTTYYPAAFQAEGAETWVGIAVTAGKVTASGAGKVKYFYNNIIVPQADLPMLKAEMKSIPLLAHARRIAVYYSQIAAFQAKTDYGFDLGDQLAEKAAGQLAYEIDTEVVHTIDNAAGTAEITWNKAMVVGVSKAEHYEGFAEAVEILKQKIYDRTQRFAPNYMLIASNILPILTFIKGFQAAPAGAINGPYFAGTLNGIKVFVSPAMKAGRFVCGVNGDDMMSSAVVYAPYMPIVPTQLLGFADGGMTQGWSTLYDMKVLNPALVIAGEVIDNPGTAGQLVTLTRVDAGETVSA